MSRGAGAAKRRQKSKDVVKNQAWYRNYRQRMNDGLEKCRRCGAVWPLRFAHLIPLSSGGNSSAWNITILCERCDIRYGNQPIVDMLSLAEEWAETTSTNGNGSGD